MKRFAALILCLVCWMTADAVGEFVRAKWVSPWTSRWTGTHWEDTAPRYWILTSPSNPLCEEQSEDEVWTIRQVSAAQWSTADEGQYLWDPWED